MRPPTRRSASAQAVLGLTLATVLSTGCGISDPLNDLAAPDHPVAVEHPNEIVAGPPADPRTLAPSKSPASTPVEAVERFADRYINWNHRTLAEVQRQLAQMSIGEASATQKRAATRTPADSELRRGRVANHGQLIGIAPARPPRTGDFVVVTRETTTGARVYDELPPAYHVTLATVSRVRGGWAISRWEPQS